MLSVTGVEQGEGTITGRKQFEITFLRNYYVLRFKLLSKQNVQKLKSKF